MKQTMATPRTTNNSTQYGSVSAVTNNNNNGTERSDDHFMIPLDTDSSHLVVSSLRHQDSTLSQTSSSSGEDSEFLNHHLHEPHSFGSGRGGGQATILAEVATISKNLLGAGSLSLSQGIAMYADSPKAVWSASLWLILLGMMFGYYCLLIAKVCKMSGGTTYRAIWTETMGSRGSLVVAVANTLLPGLGNLAYSTILSQAAVSLCQSIGLDWSRVTCLFVVTIFLLFPLCLLKNLSVLAPFSVLGTGAIVLMAVAMVIRYVDGSYRPGGIYYDDIVPSHQPSFGTTSRPWSPAVLPFVCMVFESFLMHYNAPRFYNELKRASIPRFTITVGWSFGLSALLYMVITNVGYLTFGANSDGFILNNYSALDPLATAGRVAVALSTLIIYPIGFIGFRDGVLDIFKVPIATQTNQYLNCLTVVLLSLLTITAVFITDLGLINAVAGGALATFICIIFPTLMFREAVARSGKHEQEQEVAFAMVLMVIGTALGIIGVCEAVIKTK